MVQWRQMHTEQRQMEVSIQTVFHFTVTDLSACIFYKVQIHYILHLCHFGPIIQTPCTAVVCQQVLAESVAT